MKNTEKPVLSLPWPPSALSPNTRQHWAKLAKAKKSYRAACYWRAYEQGVRRIEAERLQVAFVFYAPTKRRYDLDNLVARLKSGIDGLADLVGVDDSRWRMTFEMGEPVKGGLVLVRFTPEPDVVRYATPS